MIDLRDADIRAETTVDAFVKFNPVRIFLPIMVQVAVDEMRYDSYRTYAFTKSAEYARTCFTTQPGGGFFLEERLEIAGEGIRVGTFGKTGLNEGDLKNLVEALIITKGEEGSELIVPQGREVIPAAKPRQVKDPTGAGDAYRAGLIKGLTLGLPWGTAALMGATLASFGVEQAGTQEHRLTVTDFWRRYRDNFGAPPV